MFILKYVQIDYMMLQFHFSPNCNVGCTENVPVVKWKLRIFAVAIHWCRSFLGLPVIISRANEVYHTHVF